MAFLPALLPTEVEQPPNLEITRAQNELDRRADLIANLVQQNDFKQSTIDRLLDRVAQASAHVAQLELAANCAADFDFESGVA